MSHPARRTRHNVQNAHIADSLRAVQAAASRLARSGYTILRIAIEARNPVIWIDACKRCERLHGVEMVRRHTSTGRESVMVALMHGCQVQWTQRP